MFIFIVLFGTFFYYMFCLVCYYYSLFTTFNYFIGIFFLFTGLISCLNGEKSEEGLLERDSKQPSTLLRRLELLDSWTQKVEFLKNIT